MNEIKQALKTHIKSLKDELARSERALAALETEKATTKKPKAEKVQTPKAAASALAQSLVPDGIKACLKMKAHSSVDEVATELKLPIGKVRAAFKALVASEDILVSGKSGKTKLYSLVPEA
jgi:hypothetical protein